MHKRLMSLVLTACLFFCAGLPAAADSGDGAQSVELLQALGIGGITKDMEAVTRERFICAVSDILNYTARPQQMDGVFPDVTVKDAFSGAVYDAVSRGLIAGYEDGNFGPDAPVLAEQAVKIVVRALGYGILAEQQGGYPLGYLMTAQEKGVLKGVQLTAGEGITGNAAAVMLENALNTEVLLQVGFGENSAFEARRGRTLLTESLSLQKVTGVISDNGKTGLRGESKVGKKQVLLDGELYDAGGTGAAGLLGYRVTAYVTDGQGAPGKILYLRSDRTNTLKIAAERLIKEDSGFSIQNIVYEDVYGKTARVKVDAEADFILNGKADLDLRVEDLKISSGALLLIDNNGDLVCDVIMVQRARTMVVQSVSLNEQTIYGKMGKKSCFWREKKKPLKLSKTEKL